MSFSVRLSASSAFLFLLVFSIFRRFSFVFLVLFCSGSFFVDLNYNVFLFVICMLSSKFLTGATLRPGDLHTHFSYIMNES